MATKEKDKPDEIEVIIVEESVSIDPIQTDANGIRGANITVNGTATLNTARSDNPNRHVSSPELISEVAVQFGPSGTFVSADPTGPISSKTHQKTFSTWTTNPRAITGVVSDNLQITARMSVEVDGQPVEQPNPAVITVKVDGSPLLRLTTPLDMTEAMVNDKATFHLKGTAGPAREGADPVVAVKCALGQEQPTLATPKAPGDFSLWTADVQVSPAGNYELSVQASDEKKHTANVPVTLHAVETFEPQDSTEALGQAAYLDDLLHFAGLRMVDEKGKPLTPGRFATTFHQRYKNSDSTNPKIQSDLTNPNNRRAATESIRQLRVCVEVLRAFLTGIKKSPPPAKESKYCQAAYNALLRNLGTSFDEIRQARGDVATRATLAARLGVDQPNRLDQLLLLPKQITELKLEQLFGLQDTTLDPLRERREKDIELLTWQLNRLRVQWHEQDNAARVYGDIPVPIIDPDQLAERDFRTRNKVTDPAFKLWNERKEEVTALLKQIDDVRKNSKSALLAGFDAVVNQFVTKVEDLTTLLADYQAGKDIVPRLTEKRLDLAAFLSLIHIRDLAASGTVLDADWADVSAIAAQVVKLGRYPIWRKEEQDNGLTLSPDYFVLADPTAPPVDSPVRRATQQARRAWQTTLRTRINQQQDVIRAIGEVVDAAEAETLPGLRDLLAATAGEPAGGLLIDLTGGVAQRTTRLDQAIETLQGALFTVRVGAFAPGHSAAGWKLKLIPIPLPGSNETYTEADFDKDWESYGSHETWQGAMRVFIFPESHLLPTLRPVSVKETTGAYQKLIDPKNDKGIRSSVRITPDEARKAAEEYLTDLRSKFATLPDELKRAQFVITERMTDGELAERQALSARLLKDFTKPHEAPNFLQEVFYFVPLFCALQLQRSGEYLAALDWFQTVYAYHLPPGRLSVDKLTLPEDKRLPDRRQIYYGLTLDERIPTTFTRPGTWPREGLNPHEIVRERANALTRFVIISLVRCFEQFADAEFTRDTNESVARARTLYQTALDLLGLAYPAVGTDAAAANPFGNDPVVEALRLQAESNLRKLRFGRNIAGLERQLLPELAAGTAVAPRQPTPYRYTALIARARDLTQTSAQMEAALLAALEKRDAEQYNLLKAIQDVELTRETVDLHGLRVKEANDGVGSATLQKGRAEIQFGHFNDLINGGLSFWEKLSLGAAALGVAAAAIATGGASVAAEAGAATVGAFGSGSREIAGGLGSIFGQISSNERREDEWRLNRNLAAQDEAIGDQQITIANDQVAVTTQEQRIAQIQKENATANIRFLAGKFTNAELYEFMSEVLDGIYRFFLQQATALAKLAENQLAFERQEPPQGVIQGDYYAPPDGGPDRKGTTGSARLLANIVDLDQHAFLTDRRRLQLTKTFSLARFAPIEFAQFRETGVIVIGTPQEVFDRDFPGHYLRLVKRVRTSVIALISPIDGIRATLSSTGTSRVVIGDDSFRNVLVRRDPETVGLSSPRDATGLFELVPDFQPELLLPFEGTGVDTVWRFELPKAANPFDYSTIADVLLTIEYTALNSSDYRQQVIQTLDPELSLDRPFSLQQQFPDQWYDLNNPDQAATPMAVRFKTGRGDFLPNIDDLKIQNLVLYFAPTNGKPVEMQGVRLLFKKQSDDASVGGAADSIDGVISTRRANGSNWLPITGNKPPVGEWELALPTDDTTKNFFRNEEIEDILFVVTYSGRTPEWPD